MIVREQEKQKALGITPRAFADRVLPIHLVSV
nr:MAG TPA: hypothetical protein [Caudoviricetes sp.]